MDYRINKDDMIIAEDAYYSMDCYETKLNNNVLVVGASGTGKTRGVVIPNILQATGSYIISDPKGNLYRKYGPYLEKRGYSVRNLNFTNPRKSCNYDPFSYIKSTRDIEKIAYILAHDDRSDNAHVDPFWEGADILLFSSLIAYATEKYNDNASIADLFDLLGICCSDEGKLMSGFMDELEKRNRRSYAVQQYRKFMGAGDKTKQSILITANATLSALNSPEIKDMMLYDEVCISEIGKEKTALFVTVSDTDRSLDKLVNIFFTQAMNELCKVADELPDSRLPVPVRFILDDFATNCSIEGFPRMISSIRSRGISTMLMIQAESQLSNVYGADRNTIISNCDTYIYLGGNDIDTAYKVSERSDAPPKKILNMPVCTAWVFRRGSEPKFTRVFTGMDDLMKIREEEFDREHPDRDPDH